MGSPWPWQEPIKISSSGSSITSIHNNNNDNNNNGNINNNKRANFGYGAYTSAYYNNHRNHDFHQQNNLPHQSNIDEHHRFSPSSTSSPGSVEPMITNEPPVRKRILSPYVNFDVGPQPYQHHTSANTSVRKLQTSTSTSTEQSHYVTCVKEIPTWNIYYSDQKHRIIHFTDISSSIRTDTYINQLVSLCFVDSCITNLAVDAIVNSTTEDYSGTAGVDKLINQNAGRNLREACKSLPRLGLGQAEMTVGFSLPAKYVIHTNGPLTEDAEQLTGCYVNSLNLLLMHRLRTIVFPCISTGRKGLSKKFAAEIALRTVRQFLEDHKQEIDRVIFCLHHQKDIEIYLRYMQIYFPPSTNHRMHACIVDGFSTIP